MKKMIRLSVLSIFLSGCAMGPGQGLGQVLGGGVGALMGAQIGKGRGRLVATAMGAVLGATAGGMIGKQFDEQDQQKISQAASQAFDTGVPSRWSNSDNGRYGEIRPEPVYYEQGKPYRRFSHLAYIDGKPVTIHGKAYQASDGTWHAQP